MGILGLGAAVRQGGDAAVLIPLVLSDLKRLGCQIGRFAAASVCQGSDSVL